MPTLMNDMVAGGPLGSDAASLSYAERGIQFATPNTGQTPSLATGGTIPCNLSTLYRFTTAGPVMGILMQKGIAHGQACILINISANSATFASSATSFVADGANIALGGTRRMELTWSALDQLWFGSESS